TIPRFHKLHSPPRSVFHPAPARRLSAAPSQTTGFARDDPPPTTRTTGFAANNFRDFPNTSPAKPIPPPRPHPYPPAISAHPPNPANSAGFPSPKPAPPSEAPHAAPPNRSDLRKPRANTREREYR